MKEILKVGAVTVATAGLITLAAIKHENATPVVTQPSHTQLQLQAANQRMDSLEAQLTQLSAANTTLTTQKGDLCTFIQQHVTTKTIPMPTDCQ